MRRNLQVAEEIEHGMAQPSDEVTLRRLWRHLPKHEREAVTCWLEAMEYGPGQLASFGPDWQAMRIGDGLCRRLWQARLEVPGLTPQELVLRVQTAAHLPCIAANL